MTNGRSHLDTDTNRFSMPVDAVGDDADPPILTNRAR
jgi:hypothetical protein